MGECLSVTPSPLNQLGPGATFPMDLVCLNCASADCTCGRLDWLVNFAGRARCAQELVAAASELVLGSIDCAAERASTELEGLFVLKLRYGQDLAHAPDGVTTSDF